MKKMKKVQLLAATLGVMVAVTGIALINNPVQVKATAEETARFAMTKGAAVRAVQNEAGIRWETTVNKAWYDELVQSLATENKTITDYSFGTWVTSANNVSSVTELNEDFNTEVKNLPCDKAKTPNFTDEITTFTYYSSITYTAEDLAGYTEEQVKKAYATELIARSYMKYTLEGDETEYYAYADSNDNARCMRAVALAAYEETDPNKALDADEKEIVNDYFGTGASSALVIDGGDGVFETAEESISSNYNVAYCGAKKVGTFTGGKLELNADFNYNENVVLNLFDASGNYTKTAECKYITALLNQENFATYINVADATIDGYYVLSSNIDLGGTYYGVSNTFVGTLDGQSHTISGVSITGKNVGGLFQRLYGTVKNVSIKGTQPNKNGLIADISNEEALIENVYVETTLGSKYAGAVVRFVMSLTMRNVVINVGKTSTGLNPGGVFAYVAAKNPLLTKLEKCYCITVDGMTLLEQRTATDKNYWGMLNGGVEAVFGTAATDENITDYTVTTYTKDNKITLTAYTDDTVENAKDAFDAAVEAGTVTLSDVVKQMMGYTTTTD